MKKQLVMTGLLTMGLALAGCTSNSNELPQNTSDKTTVSSSKMGESQTSNSQNTDTAEIKLTVAEAIAVYEKNYPDTVITGIDLDTSFGAYYFEIKGVDDNTEYELKVNAETGEATKEREEKLEADETNGVKKSAEALDLNKLLTIEEATDLASEALGDAKATATDWSLDRELSITYWEVSFKSGRKESSVKLNAQTGEILETELED